MPDLLATDSLTVPLGVLCAVAFLLHTYLAPQSLVHPILLGRQADVDRTRKPGESAIYRSYMTGMMGQLPSRPTAAVRTQLDLIKPDFEGERSLWSTKVTNAELLARVKAVAYGLVNEVGLIPKESNVLLLLNDSLEFLVADFALSSISVPTFTLTSLRLLSSVLSSHPPNAIILHSFFVPQILEALAENHELSHHTFIVVGDQELPEDAERLGVKIYWWADLERKHKGKELSSITAPEPEEVYSVSFYESEQGQLKATQLSHENATAGVVATHALLPLNGPPSPSDSILSSHPLSTPMGRIVAYTAIFDGCSFSTSPSTALCKGENEPSRENLTSEDLAAVSPLPTIIFLNSSELEAISSSILKEAKKSIIMPLAWRHKLYAMQQGHLNNETVWDRWAFSSARKAVLGKADETIRAFIVSGGIDSSILTSARIALSLPLVNAQAHPLVAGPVFVSHPSDLQTFPTSSPDIAHVGPPTMNVEVKLIGVHDESVEKGANPVGEVLVRGPTVTRPLGEESHPEGWVRTGDKATVQPNGTFKVLPKSG